MSSLGPRTPEPRSLRRPATTLSGALGGGSLDPLLDLLDLLLDRLLRALRREVHGLPGGQVRGAGVLGERRVLHQPQVVGRVGLVLRDDSCGALRLLGLVEGARVGDTERDVGQGGVGLALLGLQIALPVGRRRCEVGARVLGECHGVLGQLGGGDLVLVAHQRLQDRLVVRAAGERLLVALHPLLRLLVPAAAAASLECVEETAGHAPADSEQHEASAHQDGESQVGGLDGAPAPPPQVEEHGPKASYEPTGYEPSAGAIGSVISPAGRTNTLASTMLSSYSTSRGTISSSMLTGSMVGSSAATTAMMRNA